MPTTTKYGIYYPTGSQAPNIPATLQTVAESVDTAISGVADAPLIRVAVTGSDQALTTGAKTAASFNYRIGTTGMNTTANPTRLIATKTGLYFVNTTLLFSNVANGFRSLSIRKNGIAGEIEVMNITSPSGTYNNAVTGITDIYLTAGDYIEIMAEVLTPASSVVLRAGGTANDTQRFGATRSTMWWARP